MHQEAYVLEKEVGYLRHYVHRGYADREEWDLCTQARDANNTPCSGDNVQ
jgi:hypothetical protein